jgi:lipopolysaccharide/colanic/teichoic acid biosynthesis glycosyltransferase
MAVASRWKRILDIACIAMALPAILPLMLVIALAIRLCSRGPTLFHQERIGYYGRPFVCLKFRTMKVERKHVRMKAISPS